MTRGCEAVPRKCQKKIGGKVQMSVSFLFLKDQSWSFLYHIFVCHLHMTSGHNRMNEHGLESCVGITYFRAPITHGHEGEPGKCSRARGIPRLQTPVQTLLQVDTYLLLLNHNNQQQKKKEKHCCRLGLRVRFCMASAASTCGKQSDC